MEEATAEILDSKARIEDRLGHAVETFAYPYGRYNAAVKAVVRRAFTGASAAYPGLAGAGSDPWALPRIDAHYVARQQVFRRMGNRLFGPYLGLRRSSRTLASLLLRRQW
jgi:peptidoglycan/xylan/chitin deacetylase (PgdA/CDA1 family)